jgi:hypothetical protein
MTICHGITSKNLPCKKKISKGKFCSMHISQKPKKRKDKKNKDKKRKKNEKPVESIEIEYIEIVEPPQDTDTLSNFDCPICLENVQCETLSCGHPMHTPCISQMNDKRCPLCRKDMELPEKIQKSIKKNARAYRLKRLGEQAREPLPFDYASHAGFDYASHAGFPEMNPGFAEIMRMLHFHRLNRTNIDFVFPD